MALTHWQARERSLSISHQNKPTGCSAAATELPPRDLSVLPGQQTACPGGGQRCEPILCVTGVSVMPPARSLPPSAQARGTCRLLLGQSNSQAPRARGREVQTLGRAWHLILPVGRTQEIQNSREPGNWSCTEFCPAGPASHAHPAQGLASHLCKHARRPQVRCPALLNEPPSAAE